MLLRVTGRSGLQRPGCGPGPMTLVWIGFALVRPRARRLVPVGLWCRSREESAGRLPDDVGVGGGEGCASWLCATASCCRSWRMVAAEAGSVVVVGRREMRKSRILLVSSFMAAGLVVEVPSCVAT